MYERCIHPSYGTMNEVQSAPAAPEATYYLYKKTSKEWMLCSGAVSLTYANGNASLARE